MQYYVSGTIRALSICYLICPHNNLTRYHYYHLHFSDQETKAQRNKLSGGIQRQVVWLQSPSPQLLYYTIEYQKGFYIHIYTPVYRAQKKPSHDNISFILFIFKKYLFIYFGRAGSQLRHADLFSCSMRTLSCGMHTGSSSPTRDRTRAP